MAVENVVLSRSANSQDRSLVHKTVASTFRISLLVGLFLSIGIFFAAPYLIPWIFGEAFVQSVPMIQVVLPGVLILIGFRILNSRLTGMGKPQIAIYTFLPALIINFLLNLFLIPRFGGIGAAWATNVSYAAGSFFFILVYCREVKMSFREIITLRRSDFYFFRDIRSLVKSKK